MGIFGGLFGNGKEEVKKEKKVIPWIALSSLDQLNDIKEKSKTKTQVIFKHSTTCGISRMVMNMFQESYSLSKEELDLYYLDLHAFRSVSNEAGIEFQVMHQSPQLLVIKDGHAVVHASHGAINDIILEEYL